MDKLVSELWPEVCSVNRAPAERRSTSMYDSCMSKVSASIVGLVSLNRLSVGCVRNYQLRREDSLAFEYYPCGLNNAATSRILVIPAVIRIINNCKFIYFYICVNISLILNSFIIQHYLIKCYFKFGLRTNQRLYPNLG